MDKGFRLTLNGLSATGIPWRLLGEKLLGLICEFTQGLLSNEKLQNYPYWFLNKTNFVKLLAKSFNPLASLLDSVAAVDGLRF